LRALDAIVYVFGLAAVGTLVAAPWALVNGGDPVSLREGQFAVGIVSLIAGTVLTRPKGLGPDGPPEEPGETASPAVLQEAIADATGRADPLGENHRVPLGWRLIGGGALLLVASIGVEFL